MSPTGQTADGSWEVGVRRTVARDRDSAWTLLRTLVDSDEDIGAIRSQTPGQVLRATYQPAGWDVPSTLQLRVVAAATGTTLAIHHERLPDAAVRETMRRHWTETLDRLLADG
jgi:hypothetical protein